ncbi:LacI family DNA-binding transcriptional regulator [Modestobacter sp. VKM Ac-2978]|uniref:LacI family DNA-binding transcriptional regulator n=1 Tax=Modestobacter sp. VKM Ac-2978 TaxID=3004132 RepID=UPI0022AA6898|nr:LacI family DNA-binding transcriptional regulator [Modestobacter sp. VKM Ac-2978]MCZ2849361.1 LacI family DNA-binding transcriptional regulator [Modestobacter sp. VKM Ac-2978]
MTTLSSDVAAGAGAGRTLGRLPTMVDVARAAGTSQKTVSRVVNAEPGVRPETIERVQRAIAELGFRRHDGASHLRRGTSTASIGLVLEDLAGPFYAALTAGVERRAREHGYLLLTGSADGDAERAGRLVQAFAARRVDGLLIAPNLVGDEVLTANLPPDVPAVLLDRPSADHGTDEVLSDNAGGIASAVHHLAERGHRSIAYLGDDERFWTSRQRRDGFLAACAERGLRTEGLVSLGALTPERIAAAVSGWASAGVTAVVTGNNRASVALLHHLHARTGPRPAHVGFDELDLADLLDPPLTTVAQDAAGIGSAAVDLLFERLATPTLPPRSVVVPTRLVVRRSSPPPDGASAPPVRNDR